MTFARSGWSMICIDRYSAGVLLLQADTVPSAPVAIIIVSPSAVSLSLKDLAVYDLALQATPPCNARPKILYQSFQVTLPCNILPKVRVALDVLIGAGDINQTNAHIVPYNAQLPVEWNHGGSL